MSGSRPGPGGGDTGRIRIMIVDDHPLVRAAVLAALVSDGLDVVGEAASAEDALTLAVDAEPDVMLVDIELPGMSGVQLVRELAPRLPSTRILMLTVSAADRDVMDAMRYGAAGYLTKDVSPAALARAVRATVAGELVMPRRMAARLVERLARRSVTDPVEPAGWGELSPRELDVLRLLASGLTDREIASALMLSTRTVESHVSNVLRKLGVRNRAEAAQRYRARGD